MLYKLLKDNRESIVQNWIELIFETYSDEMINFLKTKTNEFANPVRKTIVENAGRIYNGFLETGISEDCRSGLEEIIKIRAVQDFTPHEALAFMYVLKKIVREEVQKVEIPDDFYQEFYSFDEKFDELTGLAFDIYSNCREKINEIRFKELKSQTFRALEMLNRQKTDYDLT